MSNPISLFVADPTEVRESLERYQAETIDEMPFDNSLSEDNRSDHWQVDLADLLDSCLAELSGQERDLLSVLSGTEVDASQDDDLGITLAISSADIRQRFPTLIGAKGSALAKKLFAECEFWPNEKALAKFLQEWLDALTKAAKDETGLVWVVWI
jgi:hypothetical protein